MLASAVTVAMPDPKTGTILKGIALLTVHVIVQVFLSSTSIFDATTVIATITLNTVTGSLRQVQSNLNGVMQDVPDGF